MKNLIEMATKNLVIKNGKEIIGFIVCFRENSKYKSLNYKHISSLDNKFLYIDRVAIKKSFTRSGIGTAVYKMLFDHADREKLPIYCEVNIEPINMPSLDFHKKNGFSKIGEKQFEDHSVAYFKR
jgi:predicted GNAT superfamily acetyltransferase